jgi:Fe-S cluster biogenesis protein NfuA
MGGCQGCGMSRVTLQQGIEAAIVSSVPEIARVVDVTDHEAGTSPFYAPVS